jgi:RNA polymerase sigma-70 factor (ECF subfamily)
MITAVDDADDAPAWLDAFHGGERAALERLYRENFAVVHGAVSKVLAGADAETVTHDVFLKLLTSRPARESFRGGNLAAWLTRVATNAAIDYRRRYRRETTIPSEDLETMPERTSRSDTDADAVALVERFQRDVLPPKYLPVFQKRFLEQLGQREAARALDMSRTTLLYHEHKIRGLLHKFVLRRGAP